MFRSLRYRNYRLFFIGQFVSLIGNWMQHLAQSWLVYRLTKDPVHLGMIGFTSQFPIFLLTLYAGVQVDRWDRRRLVIATQIGAMLQAAALAVLTISGEVRLWHVYVLAGLLGVINAFDMPARQVLIGELVEPADRHNAIALNSTIVNGSRIVGPAVAGILIAPFGEGVCFAVNSISFLAVVVALLAMRDLKTIQPASRQSAWEQIQGGLHYIRSHRPIRSILLLLGVISMAGMPFIVLMPIFAEEILHGGPKALGLLMGSSGVGATVGALALAGRDKIAGLDRWVVKTAVFFGVILAAFAFSRSLWLSCFLISAVGVGLMVNLSGLNALLQDLASDQFRGRVMGFYAWAFLGLAPIGNLIAGHLADRIGAPWTVAIGAAACALTGLSFLRSLPESIERHRAGGKVVPVASAEPGLS